MFNKPQNWKFVFAILKVLFLTFPNYLKKSFIFLDNQLLQTKKYINRELKTPNNLNKIQNFVLELSQPCEAG